MIEFFKKSFKVPYTIRDRNIKYGNNRFSVNYLWLTIFENLKCLAFISVIMGILIDMETIAFRKLFMADYTFWKN